MRSDHPSYIYDVWKYEFDVPYQPSPLAALDRIYKKGDESSQAETKTQTGRVNHYCRVAENRWYPGFDHLTIAGGIRWQGNLFKVFSGFV